MNVTKRYLIAAAAHNLGRILRRLTGIGKPKALQGAGGLAALAQLLAALLRTAWLAMADRFGGRGTLFQEFENYGAVSIAV